MKGTIHELNNIILAYSEKIAAISEEQFSAKTISGKWSRKEVLGHLIDSAQNNLRRFICGQYESVPPKIIYNQDYWVDYNNYQQMEETDIIALWVLINKRIVAVLENMPPEAYTKSCDTGRDATSLRTLEWLAPDYVKHLKHHLNQIIPGSFAIQYP